MVILSKAEGKLLLLIIAFLACLTAVKAVLHSPEIVKINKSQAFLTKSEARKLFSKFIERFTQSRL